MAARLTVVISQGQSQNPAKRFLEEDLVARLLMESGVEVTVVPHLYDLKPDGTGMLALQGVRGDMVIVSWLYARAAHWVLDRNGICGQLGETLLSYGDDEDDEEADADLDDKDRVFEGRDIPNRKIYCLDFRASQNTDDFVQELRRLLTESTTKVVGLSSWIQGKSNGQQLQRFVKPTNDTYVGTVTETPNSGTHEPIRIQEEPGRRWYPVIDFGRCTNCMECIDFCLFGVYGVDSAETILVEQPDNCRKGCPACSRVCPENAIIFPQHKTPAIAGAAVAVDGLKIDLSKLFGAPETHEDALIVAARERDEQLMMAGREVVGTSVGMPKRQADKDREPADELDSLIDELDDLDI